MQNQEVKEPTENLIMDRANFLYITRCNLKGCDHLRNCIRDAIKDVTGLEYPQYCSIFGIYKNDAEKYIDNLYNKMKDLGAR